MKRHFWFQFHLFFHIERRSQIDSRSRIVTQLWATKVPWRKVCGNKYTWTINEINLIRPLNEYRVSDTVFFGTETFKLIYTGFTLKLQAVSSLYFYVNKIDWIYKKGELNFAIMIAQNSEITENFSCYPFFRYGRLSYFLSFLDA